GGGEHVVLDDLDALARHSVPVESVAREPVRNHGVRVERQGLAALGLDRQRLSRLEARRLLVQRPAGGVVSNGREEAAKLVRIEEARPSGWAAASDRHAAVGDRAVAAARGHARASPLRSTCGPCAAPGSVQGAAPPRPAMYTAWPSRWAMLPRSPGLSDRVRR